MASPDARRYFATDTSIFTLSPSIVVYPRHENDVRKSARFAWQLAERGRVIPITARGAGTDQSGAALGSGIMLVFPAHMNKILELDAKTGRVTVQPGINYGKLQQTLQTHGRFLPPFPASLEYCTVGGSIANNAAGEKTVKYGDTREFVRSLRVVLANGEVIETGKLGKRDLSRKLGLNSLEGEIYRQLDKLIEDNHGLLKDFKFDTTKNSAGYALGQVRGKDGFDLTPLFVGSQGTLGIITEAVIDTEVYNPTKTLIIAQFDDITKAEATVLELRKLPDMPSSIEVVDDNLLNFIEKINPNQIKDLLEKPYKKLVMLIEFDNTNIRTQKRMTKKTRKILENNGAVFEVEGNEERQDELWKIRHAASAVMAYAEGGLRALPIIEDGIVPPEKFNDYISGVYALFDKHHLHVAVWGHAGDANLHMQPFLDLSQLGDRQKIFKLMDEYYALVIGLGGSTSGEHNDGRLRGAYLKQLVGDDIYALYEQVKAIFDPHGILNPGVKMGVTLEDVKPLLRQSYSLDHLYDHMPRS